MKLRIIILKLILIIGITNISAQNHSIKNSEIKNFIGTIYMFPSFSQHKYYFKRSDGEIFGIGYIDPTEEEINTFNFALNNNSLISISGTLSEGTLDPNGKGISIKKLEIIKNRTSEYKNYTYLANEVISSSYLIEKSKKIKSDIHYLPYYIVDGQIGTCWVEGIKGPGIGEWILIPLTKKVKLQKIGISIGFDKNEMSFYDNNRIKTLKVSLNDDSSMNYTFNDNRGIQYIYFDEPIIISSLKFEIVDIYKGKKYDDTCLSEIEIWGLYN